MPYEWPIDANGRRSLRGVRLRLVSPTRFQLDTPFAYVTSDGTRIELPAASPAAPDAGLSDLASVPSFFWGLIGSYGRHTPAALVHDYLTKSATSAADQDRADAIFLDALRDPSLAPNRTPVLRAWLLWTGVSLRRYAVWRPLRLVVAVLAAVALLTAFVTTPGRVPGLRGLPAGPLGGAGTLLIVAAAGVAVVANWTSAAVPDASSWRPLRRLRWPLVPPAIGRWAVRGLAGLAVVVLAVTSWAVLAWLPVPWWLPVVGWTMGLGLSAVLPWGGSGDRRDSLLPVLLAGSAPVMLPVGLVTLLGQWLLWLPDVLLTSTDPVTADQPPERPTPTLR